MSSAVCASFNVQFPCPHFNICVKLCTSRQCIKMSSFLFVRGCAMLRILYFSCEVPFLVWRPDDSCPVTVEGRAQQKKLQVIIFKLGGGQIFLEFVFSF